MKDPDADDTMTTGYDIFARRRAALMEHLGDGVAIIPAARAAIRNADVQHPFRQSSDFYYLTGVEEPDAVLVLSPSRSDERAVLFLHARDPDRERWEGPRLGPDEAVAVAGLDAAYPLEELEGRLARSLGEVRRVYFALGVERELDARLVDLLVRFRRQSREPVRGPVEIHDLTEILHEQRVFKDEVEASLLRRATALTADAIRAAMRHTRPGRYEYELRAALEQTMIEAGSPRTSFESVVATGPNATVLHYTAGRRRVETGDLVLVDAGAEVGYLAGDLTRTWPANGRFTSAQRDAYDIVAETLRAATDACRPGVTYEELHLDAARRLTEGMISLGLLAGTPEDRLADGSYRRFFPHRLGHYVGMDVHDVGRYVDDEGHARPLVAGMALTLEPGLYVPPDDDVPDALRGVGVRIEDTVLVTGDGCEVLSRDLPREADAVAALVGDGREAT